MKESKLVLGTVQFGLKYGIANVDGKPSAEIVRQILQKAYDCGIRTLDTAAAYGESESILGAALETLGLTGRMKIVSKISPLPDMLSDDAAERSIMESIEKSLTNLKTDQLDTVLFHRERDLKYLKFLRKAKERALVRHIGASFDGEIPENAFDCDAVQVPGNVLDRRFLKFIRQAHQRGIRIHNRSIYLQGLLLMPEERIPEPLKPVISCRRELENIARSNGITPAELYMRYIFSIAEIDGILTGVDTVEQLEYNCRIARAGALPENIFSGIIEMIPELPESLIRPSLWTANK